MPLIRKLVVVGETGTLFVRGLTHKGLDSSLVSDGERQVSLALHAELFHRLDGCGKTCLETLPRGETTRTYFSAGSGIPTHAYIPPVENCVKQVKFEGKCIELALWDTLGQEEYGRLALPLLRRSAPNT
jgi:Ras family